MKEKEVSSLQNSLKSASERIRTLQKEMRELSDSRQQPPLLGEMEEEHSELRTRLQQSQLELDCRDRSLKEATARLEFSSARLGKMEEFLSSQQLRIISLENTLQETEKVTIFNPYVIYIYMINIECQTCVQMSYKGFRTFTGLV